jgi:hypothetical protein
MSHSRAGFLRLRGGRWHRQNSGFSVSSTSKALFRGVGASEARHEPGYGPFESSRSIGIEPAQEGANLRVLCLPVLSPLLPHQPQAQNLYRARSRNPQTIALRNPLFTLASHPALYTEACLHQGEVGRNCGVSGCCDVLHTIRPKAQLTNGGPSLAPQLPERVAGPPFGAGSASIKCFHARLSSGTKSATVHRNSPADR